jgi:ribosome-associated translation inhibitor RaiA
VKVQINYGDIESSDAITAETLRSVHAALDPLADRVTRVEVHLRDDKQRRAGPDDARCVIEIRLAGDDPFAVESKASDIYDAIRDAAGKARRATRRRIERRDA